MPSRCATSSVCPATVSLTLLKGTSTIAMPTPADITYATALSAPQLNPTASVPGSLVYSPAAGAVLNAGAHALSVTYAPTDGANYPPTSATVSLTVLKGTSTIAWPTPADITYGTALSATQLNATASVPGTL